MDYGFGSSFLLVKGVENTTFHKSPSEFVMRQVKWQKFERGRDSHLWKINVLNWHEIV